VLIILISNLIWNKIKRIEELKSETIISEIGEPYLMEESISPYNVTLTNDIPNGNGGLSYLKINTDKLNIRMIHDMYEKDYDIKLPEDTHIVFGAGSTMTVAALYYALQKKLQKKIYAKTNSDVFYILHIIKSIS
jgi:hypothetical protein